MKTLTMGVALIATLNLSAQQPTAANETQKQNNAVQKTQPDGLTLINHTVWLFENGKVKAITEEIWMRNGMQVKPSGTLIFVNGEKAKLKEGDFVSLKGAVARPVAIKAKSSSEVALTKK